MLTEKQLENYIYAGEIHKKVKRKILEHLYANTNKFINQTLNKNIDIYSLRNYIESAIKSEVLTHTNQPQINDGIAFPIGININNIAAHFTLQN